MKHFGRQIAFGNDDKEVDVAPEKTRAMVVAGVMSGTSADGVDVAVCRIAPGATPADSPRVQLLGLVERRYPKSIRTELLRVMGGGASSTAQMSQLHWRLGCIYADAVAAARDKLNLRLDLVGLHGQTVHHCAAPAKVLGARVRSTWQIGEAAVVADRLQCPVVSDFRPADLAAGGQGAPLVPMLDWCLFRSETTHRVLLNLGGIANLTAIPAGCAQGSVIAFDTGPGNMVIDGCMKELFGGDMDRGGATARRGHVLSPVVRGILRNRYFSSPPPKSCGRERFGADFVAGLIAKCRAAGASDADIIATATALTAESVLDAYRRCVDVHFAVTRAKKARPAIELCIAGGGARNPTLMKMVSEGFGALGVRVRPMDELGVPAQAKEGVAFALLAWLTWHRRAGNLPSATGADRPVVLGKVSFG